jgi:hypothetical protein
MTAAPDWTKRRSPPASEAQIEMRWRRDGYAYFLDVDDLHAEWSPGPKSLPAHVTLLTCETLENGGVRWTRFRSESAVACRRCATSEAIRLHMEHIRNEDIVKEAEDRVHREPASSRAASSGDDVVDRARRYVDKLDPAIAGQFGRNAMFRACQVLMRGFALTVEQAFPIALEYDAKNAPPWGPRGVREKLREAFRAGKMPMRSLLKSNDSRVASRSRRSVG